MSFTFNGIAQIVVYFLLLLLITKPMGLYLTAVFAGQAHLALARCCGRSSASSTGSVVWMRSEEQDWKIYTVAMLLFTAAGIILLYRHRASARTCLPLNPQGQVRGGPAAGVQHRGQLLDQHQLAELQRRDHHELSDADGWASPSTTSPPPPSASRWRWR